MTVDELLSLDDSTIMRGADANGKPYLPQMLRLYSETFSEVCGGCSSKFPEYLRKLRNHKKEIKVKKSKETQRKFELKPGTLIPIIGTSDAYSDKNITDDAAVQILKSNPNAIVLFKNYPENWKDLLEDNPRKKELESKTVTELKELYPEAKGNKAEIIDAILKAEEDTE